MCLIISLSADWVVNRICVSVLRCFWIYNHQLTLLQLQIELNCCGKADCAKPRSHQLKIITDLCGWDHATPIFPILSRCELTLSHG